MPRWPRAVVGVWIAIGVVSALWIVHAAPHVEVLSLLLVLATAEAVAGSSAAASVLVGLWIQRLRGRPFASSSHRLVAVLTGASLAVLALVATAIGWVPALVALGAFGVALAVVGWKLLLPTPAGVVAVLVACIVLVEVPRELGWLGFAVTHSTWSTSTNQQFSQSCRGASLPSRMAIESKLTGNVGSFVESDEPGGARMTVSGDANINWVTCMLPLVKPVALRTTLEFEIEAPGCSGHGSYVYKTSAMIYGLESCRGARKKLARELRGSLVKLAANVGR
ncbi:hypothetical protein BH11MYX1_BH11MYX1_12240 [soil metagenome]